MMQKYLVMGLYVRYNGHLSSFKDHLILVYGKAAEHKPLHSSIVNYSVVFDAIKLGDMQENVIRRL